MSYGSAGIGAAKVARALEVAVPPPVTDAQYGQNTLVSSASAWYALPTYRPQAEIFNPHPISSLRVLVQYSAWMSTTGSGLRLCPTIAQNDFVYESPGPNSELAAGWGEIFYHSDGAASGAYAQYSATCSATVPALTAFLPYVFELYAYRDGTTGTQKVGYPVMRVVPLFYV